MRSAEIFPPRNSRRPRWPLPRNRVHVLRWSLRAGAQGGRAPGPVSRTWLTLSRFGRTFIAKPSSTPAQTAVRENQARMEFILLPSSLKHSLIPSIQ
jgi:hypothetical protein